MSSKIDKVLAFDSETSGINYDAINVAEGYQMVSCGFIVADLNFNPIDELYVQIKWNGVSNWDDRAEAIHGMSKQYLEKYGVAEEEAAQQISLFLYKHYGIDKAITLLGHNVATFDMQFLKGFLWKHGCPFKFSHRHCDSFALSMGTVQAFDSNELFDLMGFEKRKAHNALEDARMSLKTYKTISNLWKKHVG